MPRILLITAVLIGLTACQSSSQNVESLPLEEKKRRLEKLRQDLLNLQAQITELERLIQAEDSAFGLARQIPVSFIVLKPRPFAAYLQFQGSVDNREVINLSAKILAPVSRIYVREGQNVAAGQILLEQEAEVLRKNLAELKTRLELTRTLYEKQKKLYEEGIGSEVQYLTTKNNKEALEASIATLEEQLRNAQIRAPFSGQVDAIQARVGEILSPGVPAIRLVSSGQWEIKSEIPESFLSTVSAGKEVEVHIPDLGVSFPSQIANVSRNINPLSRTFTVIVREVPADIKAQLRPNLIAYIRIPQSKATEALIVPIDAIQFQDTSAYAYVVRGDRARRVRVRVVSTERGEAAIVGPVKSGDTLVTTGAALVTDGQRVQLVAENM
ncbi:MAG: efflux RND transporter periplasmic adaptor subunit [Bacteroidia bacterium]|nr:efflux RND transporter periplasmic adaptor subunit [Bacteroidia bacterium]MCX7652649.1 efflux RND transporter periplasmic adaptor subunit [Bacteroidia bacterium]MDW8416997.1 efflux RND transporter periplasmic adaptor subunit [Bacteroidia bacterium]